MGQSNIFGKPPPVPSGGSLSPVDADDDLYAEDAAPEYGGEETEDEDLEHPGMASLTGISIKRGNDAGLARPAVQSGSPGSGGGVREQAPPRDLAEYWSRLRKGRRWPARSDIDPKVVSLRWPNTMLMRVEPGNDHWRPESLFTDVMRGGGGGFGNGEIAFTPMIMNWILSQARNAERGGSPVEDTDSFPTDHGDKRYRAIAVPLSDDDTTVNHILCHVESV